MSQKIRGRTADRSMPVVASRPGARSRSSNSKTCMGSCGRRVGGFSFCTSGCADKVREMLDGGQMEDLQKTFSRLRGMSEDQIRHVLMN